jgi:KDO2-lipid IV(A) lauroyltransferase
MARKRSAALAYLVYLAVRALICIAQAVPSRLLLPLAGPLAWLVYLLDRRHRVVATENIRHAFPHLTPGQVDGMVRATYLHFVTVLLEVAQMPRVLTSRSLSEHFFFADEEARRRFEGAILNGRPAVVLTGHLGNWEVLCYGLGLMGHHAHIVARPLDNPYLDRYFRWLRCRTGQRLIDKSGAYPAMRRAMKAGERVAIVGDQDAGEKGLFVEFLGRPASTFKPTAHLALSHDAQMVVIAAVRVGPMRFEMRVTDVIEPREYEGSSNAVLEVTQRYSRALEALVHQAPEQYFWLHRRWKHQPPPMARAA